MSDKVMNDCYQGWLWKWTNYVKGYQQRWFVLSNGLFSYYRTQNEMDHTCRGTINLASAFIISESDCNFMVSNGASQTFHLKANSSEERKHWLAALENAKLKSMIGLQSDDDSSDESSISRSASTLQGASNKSTAALSEAKLKIRKKFKKSKVLSKKLEELFVCNELIVKHNAALQNAVDDIEAYETGLEKFSDSAILSKKLKHVREQAILFNITASAMLNSCSEFLQASEMEVKSWPDLISEENDHVLVENYEDSAKNDVTENGTHHQFVSHSSGRTKSVKTASEQVVAAQAKKMSLQLDVSTTGGLHKQDETASEDDEEFLDALSAACTVPAKSRSTPQKRDSNIVSTSNHTKKQAKQYRTKIPEKPDYSLNVWNVLKNCIGKDLSRIPMPVNFNEPLSFLQRLVEDIKYIELIHSAAECESAQEQMAYVVALSVSTYCSTKDRITKPFNPILGETFEFDRRSDLGFRAVCEQVSHHPPAAAVYAESADCGPNKGWSYWTAIQVTSKFRGKYLSVNPLGTVHLKFHASGNHYTWRKITTTVHNIIVGTIWVDQSGESVVRNHRNGDHCVHRYFPYSYFSSDTPRKVMGVVKDKDNVAHYQLTGAWDSHIDCAKIDAVLKSDSSNPRYKTQTPKRLWQKETLPENADKMYYFSEFAMSLNEAEDGVAPTDSRLRPDQRAMENGDWNTANTLKLELEESQRKRIRGSQKLADTADTSTSAVQPLWFDKTKCELAEETTFKYNGKYWAHKEEQNWSKCPNIFSVGDSLRLSITSSKQDLSKPS